MTDQSKNSDLFKTFIVEMNKILKEDYDGKRLDQKEIMECLFAAEDTFRDTLLSVEPGREMYDKFVRYILKNKKSIMSAKVYFRERQETFTTAKMKKVFRSGQSDILHGFRINYSFAEWVMKRYRGPKRAILKEAFGQILDARRVLVENNLPFAVNRAMVFWHKVPKVHLEYMDYLQDCGEGFLKAIDKFVPPDYHVFRGVVNAHMSLNMMTEHNATLIKMSPTERRILYRAKTAKYGKNLSTDKEVTDYVKESFKNATAEEIAMLSSAAGDMVNLEGTHKDDPGIIKTKATPENLEEDIANRSAMSQVLDALTYLSVIERKVIRLKHGYNMEVK